MHISNYFYSMLHTNWNCVAVVPQCPEIATINGGNNINK